MTNPANPIETVSEMRLDDTTERAIEAFGAAKWKHGRNGPSEVALTEVERQANALRFRIHELLQVERQEGFSNGSLAERGRILAGLGQMDYASEEGYTDGVDPR